MSVVVDVSGSMGWELNPTSNASLASALNITSSEASTISGKMDDAVDTYYLTSENVTYILENYTFDDCNPMGNNTSTHGAFLNAIGKWTGTSKKHTKRMCEWTTRATKDGLISHETVLDNLETLTSVAHPQIKIDAIKQALSELFAQFNVADPTKTYVRTGLSAYAYGVRGDTDIEWGTGSAGVYASGMYASDGTASTNSVKWAFNELKNSNTTEANEHKRKNGQIADRFILFMTDGDNNYTGDDTATQNYCDQAKADNIQIYSVAFATPPRGQRILSYCASEGDYYYEPETTSKLIAAFKNIGAKSSLSVTRLTN